MFSKLEPRSEITLFYEVKADLTGRELQILSRAGVKELQPGIEALATSTLKLMKKGTTVFTNLALLKNCLVHGVYPFWNLLIGFPGEKEDVYRKYLRDFPLLTHLSPPDGVNPVRFDRYSPYFRDADAFGLDLNPYDYYGLIYPFEEASLHRLAYYFMDHNIDAEYFVNMARWIDPIRKQVERWRLRWVGKPHDQVPKLYVEKDERGGARVFDSRSEKAVEYPIGERTHRVLKALAKPLTRDKLAGMSAQLGGISELDLEEELAALSSRGLLFEEDGRLMSLGLESPPKPVSGRTLYGLEILMGAGDRATTHRFPLSYAQERVWFHHEMEPASTLYNMYLAVELAGPLDCAALERSLQAVVNRHESLRTTFESAGGRPVQVIAEAQRVELPVLDCSELPEDERLPRALEAARVEYERPFVLTRGPLLRPLLIRLRDDAHVFFFATHHAVFDQQSLDVFCRELSVVYRSFAAGSAPALPPPRLQYVDFAEWQRGRLESGALDAHETYWVDRLRGLPERIRAAVRTARRTPIAPRSAGRADARRGIGRSIARAGRSARGHAVHDHAGSVPHAAASLHRRAGPGAGNRGVEPQPRRARVDDWFPRQHSRAAGGPVRESHLLRAAGAGATGVPRRLRESRGAFSTCGRAAAPRPRS